MYLNGHIPTKVAISKLSATPKLDCSERSDTQGMSLLTKVIRTVPSGIWSERSIQKQENKKKLL